MRSLGTALVNGTRPLIRFELSVAVKGLSSPTISNYTPPTDGTADKGDLGGVTHHYGAGSAAILSVRPSVSDADLAAMLSGITLAGDSWSAPQLPGALCATDKGTSMCAISSQYVVIIAAAPTPAGVTALLSAEVDFVIAVLFK